jgi:hypothetical protein
MEIGNNENEPMGDGEVVNVGEEPPRFPDVLTVTNGEQMLYWEHKVTSRTFDLDFVLVREFFFFLKIVLELDEFYYYLRDI